MSRRNRLRQQFPPRRTRPLLRTQTYVDRRIGALDVLRDRRAAMALLRTPLIREDRP